VYFGSFLRFSLSLNDKEGTFGVGLALLAAHGQECVFGLSLVVLRSRYKKE
jgi:hypothetical protein